MTIILIAYDKETNSTFVACDSQSTLSHYRNDQKERNNMLKFFRQEALTVACCGNLRTANVLEYTELTEPVYIYEDLSHKQVVTEIVPKMFKALEDANNIVKVDGLSYMQGDFIVTNGKNIFNISGDGAVTQHEEFCCSGSGCIIADGAWNIIKDNTELNTLQKIIHIMMATLEKDIYTAYPIKIMNVFMDDVIVLSNKDEALEAIEKIKTVPKQPKTTPNKTVINKKCTTKKNTKITSAT